MSETITAAGLVGNVDVWQRVLEGHAVILHDGQEVSQITTDSERGVLLNLVGEVTYRRVPPDTLLHIEPTELARVKAERDTLRAAVDAVLALCPTEKPHGKNIRGWAFYEVRQLLQGEGGGNENGTA